MPKCKALTGSAVKGLKSLFAGDVKRMLYCFQPATDALCSLIWHLASAGLHK